MSEVKTIKGVSNEAWNSFKSIAARNGMGMGKAFENMVDRYEKDSSDFWESILNWGKILSDKEASAMMKTIKKSRNEYGFRK